MYDSEKTFDLQPFTISELIEGLQTIKDEHGGLQIAVRTIDDDTGLVRHAESVGIWVLLKKDMSFKDSTDKDLEDKFLSIG